MTAEEKAKELCEVVFKEPSDVFVPNKRSLKNSIKCCEVTISSLQEVKGMGKISKIKFWRKVMTILQDRLQCQE